MDMGEYVATCSFRNKVDGFEWAFAAVYGPNGDSNRGLLWDELSGLMCLWNLPWCIGSDFNVIRFPSERSGGRRTSSAMKEFSNFIFEMGLMDLPLVSVYARGPIIVPGLELIASGFLKVGSETLKFTAKKMALSLLISFSFLFS
jgi:hypothetical protein